MTTPADAQIGAAYIQGFEDCTNARTDRYAALTAAAEVGPVLDYDLKCTNGHDLCYMGTSDDCPYCERVPATAEVGRMSAWDDRYSGSAKEIEAHTIERCAQVADGFNECDAWSNTDGRHISEIIAAAIRALKDKP